MGCLRVLLLLVGCSVVTRASQLKPEFTWQFISFATVENTTLCSSGHAADDDSLVFPGEGQGGYSSRSSAPGAPRTSPQLQLPASQNGEYIAENNVPMGVSRYGHRLFVTVPRRRPGIPGTLNYLSLRCKARHNAPLTPYPSWEMNRLEGQRPKDPADPRTPIVSVYRTTVDQCHRLWFVDMGTLEYPSGRERVQPMSIVVVDLRTDQVIRRHPLKADHVTERSTIPDLAVDVSSESCDEAYAYLPDVVHYRLLVYSFKDRDTWMVNHNYFHLMPRAGDLTIGGHSFQWDDGVFSVALSSRKPNGHRTAYFHAMVSTEEFSVCTCVLKNRTLATRSYHEQDFKFVGDRGADGQSSTHALHQRSGIMFFGEISRNGIACWDTSRPFSQAYDKVHYDPQRMIYPGDVRVDAENQVWMMTNSMPVFSYGRLDYSQVNFRIWTADIRDAVIGTKCDPRKH